MNWNFQKRMIHPHRIGSTSCLLVEMFDSCLNILSFGRGKKQPIHQNRQYSQRELYSFIATFMLNLVKNSSSFKTSVVHKHTLINDNTVIFNRNRTVECMAVCGVCVCVLIYLEQFYSNCEFGLERFSE